MPRGTIRIPRGRSASKAGATNALPVETLCRKLLAAVLLRLGGNDLLDLRHVDVLLQGLDRDRTDLDRRTGVDQGAQRHAERHTEQTLAVAFLATTEFVFKAVIRDHLGQGAASGSIDQHRLRHCITIRGTVTDLA